jgi:hypothetical protein
MTQRFINCWSEQTPIRVDNHLAGTDPVPGASKKLTITFSDFQTLEFPEESMIDSSLLLKIPFKQISRIEYGHVDVMTSFMNQWAHTNDFLITNKSMGLDPLPGQIKNLQIILTDGRQLQLVEGQIFHPLVLLKLLQAP